MTSYTITITPDGPANTYTTMLRVRTTGDRAFVTEVHVQADSGLAKGPIPAIDFGLLVRAISGGNLPTETDHVAARSDAAAEMASADNGGSRTRRAAKQTAGAGRTRTRGVAKQAGATARAAAPAARGRATKAARAAEAESGARVYRRLPDDFVAVYESVGGATAAAAHYGVPRHTVQGWLRRLRQEGVLPAAR
jgi:hypothetical protein